MSKHRLAATAAVTALALVTSQVLAAPTPSGTQATATAVKVPNTIKYAQIVIPHFDGKLINSSLASGLVQSPDALLGYSSCKVDGHALIDGCMTLSVGNEDNQVEYTLIETKCPSGTPSSACYGGYVIAARADTHTEYDARPDLKSSSHTDLRVGLAKFKMSKKRIDSISYSLPTAALMTIDQSVTSTASTWGMTVKVVLAGDTIIDDGWTAIAASSGTTSCAELAATLAALDVAVGSTIAGGIGVAIAGAGVLTAAVGVAIGGAIAVIGTGGSLTLATLPAVAAGAAVASAGIAAAAAGIALGTLVALTGREVSHDVGKFEEGAMREMCEQAAKVENFNPEDLDLDDILDTSTTGTDGGGCPSGSASGTRSYSYTDDSGTEWHCDQDVTISCTGGTLTDGSCDCDTQDAGTAVCTN